MTNLDSRLQAAINSADKAGNGNGKIDTATERKAFLLALGATKSTNNGVGEKITRLDLSKDADGAALSALEAAGIQNKGYQKSTLTGGDLEEMFRQEGGFTFDSLKAKLGGGETNEAATNQTRSTTKTDVDYSKLTEDAKALVEPLEASDNKNALAANGPIKASEIPSLLQFLNLQPKEGTKFDKDYNSFNDFVADTKDKVVVINSSTQNKENKKPEKAITEAMFREVSSDNILDKKELEQLLIKAGYITQEDLNKVRTQQIGPAGPALTESINDDIWKNKILPNLPKAWLEAAGKEQRNYKDQQGNVIELKDFDNTLEVYYRAIANLEGGASLENLKQKGFVF